ncbi:hypothetical protein K8Z61_14150 [Nocardioides sp. TRM66260-LWL]|uniref:hypothetical protein n=1 Tax=Nocardioides sp. TRM66260-LWL TaxID=2874478 RepID=UPI001CC55B71|nr:hypothetical protein [Nocardioides sp. TRM66260-LWL]MBZ5735633.1 hypothetical protein [Nocardioides sp. TRM66260-LWL]
MAVTVVTSVSQGEPVEGDFYPDAGHFFVEEGHLNVVFHNNNPEPRAVYTPGSWAFAFIGEKVDHKMSRTELINSDA